GMPKCLDSFFWSRGWLTLTDRGEACSVAPDGEALAKAKEICAAHREQRTACRAGIVATPRATETLPEEAAFEIEQKHSEDAKEGAMSVKDRPDPVAAVISTAAPLGERVTRRRFMVGSTVGAAALLPPIRAIRHCDTDGSSFGGSADVIVVGAGLAGLSAAFEI